MRHAPFSSAETGPRLYLLVSISTAFSRSYLVSNRGQIWSGLKEYTQSHR